MSLFPGICHCEAFFQRPRDAEQQNPSYLLDFPQIKGDKIIKNIFNHSFNFSKEIMFNEVLELKAEQKITVLKLERDFDCLYKCQVPT